MAERYPQHNLRPDDCAVFDPHAARMRSRTSSQGTGIPASKWLRAMASEIAAHEALGKRSFEGLDFLRPQRYDQLTRQGTKGDSIDIADC
jgi:hypothetical protein